MRMVVAVAVLVRWRWRGLLDDVPTADVLLTLVLSLQASYAAPLILLAQNRQEDRDRIITENDRKVAERTQADTEFLAREIASIRLSLADVPTTTELDDQFERIATVLERLAARLDHVEGGRHSID